MSGIDKGAFYHEFFLRDDESLASKIHRSTKARSRAPVNKSSGPPNFYAMAAMPAVPDHHVGGARRQISSEPTSPTLKATKKETPSQSGNSCETSLDSDRIVGQASSALKQRIAVDSALSLLLQRGSRLRCGSIPRLRSEGQHLIPGSVNEFMPFVGDNSGRFVSPYASAPVVGLDVFPLHSSTNSSVEAPSNFRHVGNQSCERGIWKAGGLVSAQSTPNPASLSCISSMPQQLPFHARLSSRELQMFVARRQIPHQERTACEPPKTKKHV